MNFSISVSDEHFRYLRLQKGSLDRLADDRKAWHAAYEADLQRTFKECEPCLPIDAWGILDIGSGLGGIDVLFYRHYLETFAETRGKSAGPFVNLLDGEDDPPEMKLHRETFNSMTVARDFMKVNGVDPLRFAYYTPQQHNLPKPYSLVVSFGSWCFHYAPSVYLPLLMRGGGLDEDTVLIVDVRKGKPEWTDQLHRAGLSCVEVIRDSEKFCRCVLRRR